ncbi:MAG: Alpha-L-rhamnosidase [Bacilli bacterium]|nr:Alpha-L-rhamnosidase [Bacilli bacterium]
MTDQAGWIKANCFAELEAELRSRLLPNVEWLSGVIEHHRVAILRRDMEDGSTVYFIANSTPQVFEDVMRVSGTRGEVWNALDGTSCSMQGKAVDGKLDIPVSLEAASGSLLLRIYDEIGAETDELQAPHAVPARRNHRYTARPRLTHTI